MDLSLFKKVTKIENDELKGLKIDLVPEEYRNQMKTLKQEFNQLLNKIHVDGLRVDDLDDKWQGSGYYKKYFWTKIFFKDTKYFNKDLCLWIGANIDGLHIYLGTSDDFNIASKEDVFQFIINKIDKNKEFKNFKIDIDHYLFRYAYTGDKNQIDENDFIKVLEYLKPIYKIVLDKFIFKSTDLDEINKNNMGIKNIILYGAPGVGKTHNYQNIISMIEEGKNQNEIFDTVSKNLHVDSKNDIFESIKKEDRVEFVTFHQSYSYEDFIEGYRPNDNGNIELKDGIFKNISNKARKNLKNSQKNKDDLKYEKSIEYKLEDFINDSIDNEKEFKKTKQGVFKIESFDNDKILIFAPDSNYNENRLELSFLELLKVALYEGDFYSSKNMAKFIFNKNNQRQSDTYYYNIFKEFEKVKDSLQTVEIDENNQLKNFYIVIDEINRGNISKIFGELITLIEEDKRDTYEVTLPYSKEKFKVPSNLYIIATMNSTDKSIATIDIALRRRFTFLKMKPNVDLVHVKAKELFNNLNKFIKENLNEDYMLGHSYFMKIENDEDLEFVKEYKIKPLLEEYFYADDENFKKAIDILNKENSND